MAVAKTIVDDEGQRIYPTSVTKVIYDLEGTDLDTLLSNKLGISDTADNSVKLGGVPYTKYMTDENIYTYIFGDETTTGIRSMAGGIAALDEDGLVPSSQLPSYVDDIIEGYYYEDKFYKDKEHTEKIAEETGKIYVDLSTNISYRWGGTTFVKIADVSIATTLKVGVVKPDGNTIVISEDGTISGTEQYVLPTASTTVLGGVKIDGDTIKINDDGVIRGTPQITDQYLTLAEYEALPDTKYTDGIKRYIIDYTESELTGDAKDIIYDNETSGLTAINVQDALDEIDNKLDTIDLSADKISYDNSTSALSSTNVQGAIDELVSKMSYDSETGVLTINL